MALLPHDHILKLHAAVISAQLVASRSALLTGIDGHFVAGLPCAENRADQILQDLNAMNETGELADGSMPLATWLANAIGRTRGRREEAIFAEALERVRPGSSATASSPGTAAPTAPAPGAAPVVNHHHGDVIMGSTFTTSITGSTIGAVAVGDHATATGTVHVAAATPVTQAQHEEHVRKAKKALVDDEGKLDELVHEALTQFLPLARKTQVEQQSAHGESREGRGREGTGGSVSPGSTALQLDDAMDDARQSRPSECTGPPIYPPRCAGWAMSIMARRDHPAVARWSRRRCAPFRRPALPGEEIAMRDAHMLVTREAGW